MNLETIMRKRNTRIAYCEKDLEQFKLFYFPQFFSFRSAPFHKKMTNDLASEDSVFIKGFRESWKTIETMVALIHTIAYRKRRYIMYYSLEQKISAARLYDIIIQLQTNQRIINDFWNLFPDRKFNDEEGITKSSVGEFVTTNRIKVRAMSMGTTPRGALFVCKDWAFRPDMVVFDDIDTISSVRNPEIIEKNYEFLKNEILWGLAEWAKIIILWNVIGQDGLIPRIEKDIESDNRFRKLIISIYDKEWKITWDRFVETDEEATAYNQWKPISQHKISLESKRRKQWEAAYKANFLLIPMINLSAPVFDIELLQNLKAKEPLRADTKYPELLIFEDLLTDGSGTKIPYQNLMIGSDTSLGNPWGDYATIVVRDRQGKLMATYRGHIKPDLLVWVYQRLFELGYRWVLAPENNNTGIATINKARDTYLVNYLYVEKTLDKISEKSRKTYGWNTNGKTKPLMISELDEAIRLWHITEFDERSLAELRSYAYGQNGEMEALAPNHDDMVMAEAITWQMRKYSITTF